MNKYLCVNEPKLLQAVQSGVWDVELRVHVENCPLCADVLIVAELLRQETEPATEPVLPGAGFLWWKSQLRARQSAVRYATRPITLAGACAYLICGVTLFWCIATSAQAQGWVLNFLNREPRIPAMWAADWSGFALLGVGGAIVCAIAGALYMVWTET